MTLPNFGLAGKVAIVTGANGSIGEGIALALAGAGSDLALVDSKVDRLEQVAGAVRGMGRKGVVRQTDITREDQVAAMVQSVGDELGHIDILVNNAGVALRIAAESTSLQQWQETIDVNLTGTFLCGREVGKVFIRQKKGKILNITSINSAVARPNLSAYGASKSGVMQLTRCWALEWAPHHVNVNAIAPSFVDTEMMQSVLQDPVAREQLLARIPLGRIGSVVDVAASAVFLCSAAADYITGHTLFVDGGWVIQ